MKNNTVAVLNGWTKGQKYAEDFYNASKGTGKYKTTTNAVSEIASGLWHIANEVAAEKIANCFNESGDPLFDKEESRFSNNSKKDFADNIRNQTQKQNTRSYRQSRSHPWHFHSGNHQRKCSW